MNKSREILLEETKVFILLVYLNEKIRKKNHKEMFGLLEEMEAKIVEDIEVNIQV